MEKILEELELVLDNSLKAISNLSNASAIINKLPNLNWCGFYLLEDNQLILGPFQGEIACTVIKIGKGVCGTAVSLDKTLAVSDVNKFPGHIACSSLSKSEIVIPIHKDGKIFGVLDIDSPILDRFKKEDVILLESAVKIIEEKI